MALDRDREVSQVGFALTTPQGPVAAGADMIHMGGMLQTTAAGYLAKVGDSANTMVGPVKGVANYRADIGSGAAGSLSICHLTGLFTFKNSSTSPVTWASYGKTIYAEDDETLTSDSSYPVAGTMWGFTKDEGGTDVDVYVLIGAGNAALSAAKSASVPLPLAAFYETDGTPLAAFADGVSTTPGLSLNDSECAGIRWNNDAAPDPIVTSMPIPSDLDTTRVCYLIFTAAKVGATSADVPKLGVEVFEHPVGALYDAGADLGGDTNAMADEPTKEVQALALAIAADSFSDPSAANNTMTITVTPEAGKLGTDDLVLISARLAYTPII